jgi:hypothetical protein
MTAAPRKGRKVSFEAAATAPEADPWSQISTLRFMIDPPYGGELARRFHRLAATWPGARFARGLFMAGCPRGPIMVRSSIKTYVTSCQLLAYLAGTGDRINGPADLRAHHIDGFERGSRSGQVARARADLCRQGRFRPSPHRGR